MGLDGKQVLVIGGGSGIGFAVAEGAAAEGAVVTIASTNAERLAEAAARLGGGVQAAGLDITDEPAVQTFFAGRGFDHIVTTAGDWGGPRRAALADMDIAGQAAIFKVRFWGALTVAKHGAAALSPGGSLTLTGGMIAHKPAKGSAASTAMAGAIEFLTRGLAVELAPLRVNCVCPGYILTGVWDSIPAAQREGRLAALAAGQLVPRVGDPAEAAQAYLYAMKAGFTTGQVLYVEGGLALGG